MQQFSQYANKLTGTEGFAAGDSNALGRFAKYASLGIDMMLEDSGATKIGSAIGGRLGSLMGKEELGRDVGQQLPRGVVNMLPLLASRGAIPAALMSGTNAYEQTNSPLRGAIAGVATVAAPRAIGRILPAASNKILGKGLSTAIANKVTSTTAGGVAGRFTGNLLDSFLYDTATELADIAVAPERSLGEIGTSDFWAAQAIGNTAFAPLDLRQAFTAQAAGVKRKQTEAMDYVRSLADSGVVPEGPINSQSALMEGPINSGSDLVTYGPFPPSTDPNFTRVGGPVTQPYDVNFRLLGGPRTQYPATLIGEPFTPVENTSLSVPTRQNVPVGGPATQPINVNFKLQGGPKTVPISERGFELIGGPKTQPLRTPTNNEIIPYNPPTTNTSFGKPVPTKADLPESPAVRVEIAVESLTNIMDLANKPPQTFKDYVDQIDALNQSWVMQDKLLSNDTTLAADIARQQRVDNTGLVEASNTVLQRKKNETVIKADKSKKAVELTEVDQLINTMKDELGDSVSARVVKNFSSRLKKNEGSPEYLDQALAEFTTWKVNGETDDQLFLRLDNVKARVNRIEANLKKAGPVNKGGRPNKIKDEDLSKVWEEVDKLKPETKNEVYNAFSKFMQYVQTDSPTVGNSAARVIVDWLALPKDKQTNKALRGMFGRVGSQLAMNHANKRKDNVEFDENFMLGEDSTRSSFEEFEDTYDGRQDLNTDYDTYDANSGEVLVDVATNVLMRDGNTPGFSRALAPEITKITKVFEYLTGQKVAVGELLNADGTLVGLSSRSTLQNLVFLDPNLRGTHAKFVAAHEILGHQLKKLYTLGQLDPRSMKSYARAIDFMQELTPTDRATLLSDLSQELLPPKLHKDLSETLTRTTESLDETMSNLSALFAFASASDSNLSGVLKYMPQRVYDFGVASMKFLREAVRGLKSFAGINTLRGVKMSSLKEISELKDLIANVGVKLELEDVAAQAGMAKLDRAMVGGMGRTWEALSIDGAKLEFDGNEATNALADAMFLSSGSETRKVLSGIGEGIVHKLERYPALREVSNAMRGEDMYGRAITRSVATILFAKGVKKNGRPNIEKDMGPLGRVMKSPKANYALDEIMKYQNVEDVNFLSLQKSDPATFDKMLEGLTTKEVSDVTESLARFQRAMGEMQKEILVVEEGNEVTNLATILRDDMTGTNKQVLEGSGRVIEAYKRGDGSLDIIARELGIDPAVPKAYLDSAYARIERMKAIYTDREHFVTMRRMKQFQISYTKKGHNNTGRIDASSPEEALRKVKELKAQGAKIHYDSPGYKDTYANRGGSEKQFDRFNELLEAAHSKTTDPLLENMLKNNQISQEAYDGIIANRAEFRSTLSGENVHKDINDVSMTRLFKDGYEDLNYVEQQMLYFTKLASRLPRTQTDATMRFERKNPEIAGDERNLRGFEDAKRGLANFRRPDSALGNMITRGNFLHYLGFNVSSGMIEASQFPVHLSPKLKEEGASLVDAYTLPMSAIAKIADHNFSGEWNSGTKVKVGNKQSDLYEMLLRKAEKEGRLGLGLQQDVLDAGNSYMSEIGRMAQGKQPLFKEALTTAHGALMNATSKFYGIFTGFNEQIALLSAVEMLKKKNGLGDNITQKQFDELYTDATRIAGMANSSFGRVDRAVTLFEGNRTFAQALDSLQGFNKGMFSNLFRYAQKGFTKELDGLTPKQRKDARQALYMSIGALSTMAGVISGIPLAGPIVAILEDKTDLKVQENMRLFMQDLEKTITGNEGGSFLADTAAHGLSYALGAPMDFSQRVAVGGILGFNAYEGWSPKALLGPTISRGGDYIEAAVNVFKGDATKAVENALPVGIRKLFKMWQDNGSITDKDGKTLLVPTTGEQVSNALGFAPTRMTAAKELKRLEGIQDRIRKDDDKKFHKEFVETYKTQGSGLARAMLLRRAEDITGYDPRAGLKFLQQEINTSRDGYDPRLEGSLRGAEERAELRDTFNPEMLPQANLVESARSNIQVASQLGMPVRNASQDMLLAIMTEGLRGRSNLPVPVLKEYAGNLLNPQMSNRSRDLLSVFANTSRRQ